MSLEIREIVTRHDLREFIRFPLDLYRGNPYYVPLLGANEMSTLRRDKNPAFEYCLARYWMAYKNGKPAGRIAGILNRLHIVRWDQHFMRFGWLDFIDDYEVSAALLKQVENWAFELELKAVHGPLGFSVIDREGILVEGFDQPGTVTTNYNYPYYSGHLERLGYEKDNDWLEYRMEVPDQPVAERVILAQEIQAMNNLHFHQFLNKDELLYYIDQINDLMNRVYLPLYGVVPLSPKQIEIYVDQFFGFMDMKFIPAVMDKDDRLIGFAFTLPSLTNALQSMKGRDCIINYFRLLKALNWNDRADLYQVIVHPDYARKGVTLMLMHHIFEVFKKHGIRYVETNPESDILHERMMQRWECYHIKQHKRRRVYIKQMNRDLI